MFGVGIYTLISAHVMFVVNNHQPCFSHVTLVAFSGSWTIVLGHIGNRLKLFPTWYINKVRIHRYWKKFNVSDFIDSQTLVDLSFFYLYNTKFLLNLLFCLPTKYRLVFIVQLGLIDTARIGDIFRSCYFFRIVGNKPVYFKKLWQVSYSTVVMVWGSMSSFLNSRKIHPVLI